MVVQNWAKALTEKVMGEAPFAIGDIVRHPNGYDVKIVAGQYWGESGLSNHWSWRRVLSGGALSAEIESGYGWRVTQLAA